MQEERKKYGEAFRGIADIFCGSTSGKGASSRDRNEVCCMEEVAKAVGEKKEVWKRIEKIKDRGGSRMRGCYTCMAEEESSTESCG